MHKRFNILRLVEPLHDMNAVIYPESKYQGDNNNIRHIERQVNQHRNT